MAGQGGGQGRAAVGLWLPSGPGSLWPCLDRSADSSHMESLRGQRQAIQANGSLLPRQMCPGGPTIPPRPPGQKLSGCHARTWTAPPPGWASGRAGRRSSCAARLRLLRTLLLHFRGILQHHKSRAVSHLVKVDLSNCAPAPPLHLRPAERGRDRKAEVPQRTAVSKKM